MPDFNLVRSGLSGSKWYILLPQLGQKYATFRLPLSELRSQVFNSPVNFILSDLKISTVL